jgi:dihydrofolate reductase
MAKVLLGMTMSLDGFINDRNGSVESLYPDLQQLGKTEMLKEVIAATGAVVMGWNAFTMGNPDEFADNYEFQVPLFVLCGNAPERMPKQNDRLTITFVTDGIESAIKRAKVAAGDKNVQVIGGASVAQQCLRAGLADELQVGIMPVLLCGGLRFFDNLGNEPINLERVNVFDSPPRLDLRFRFLK